MIIMILEDDTAFSKGIELALAAPDRQFTLCRDIGQAKAALETSSPD
jgi:DNA-binding response OmpR family regulator